MIGEIGPRTIIDGGCVAEVWQGFDQYRCSRRSSGIVRTAYGPLHLCTQHQRTLQRRGEWVLLPTRSEWVKPAHILPEGAP